MLAGVFCFGIALAGGRDGATIVNSGSTNFTGYTVKVWSDGSASAMSSGRMGNALSSPSAQNIPPALVQKLLADLQAAKDAGSDIHAHGCMKSVSFGSTMIVKYHGWTSPDLNCPGGGFVNAIGSDAHAILAAMHIQGVPYRRRVPMLPNERRMPEPAPTTS